MSERLVALRASTSATMSTMDANDRWIVVVGGRRWRATDPSIPSAFKKELVDELMNARRSVGAARRADNAQDTRIARARVEQAKVALGERGVPWWDDPCENDLRQRFEATIATLARHRGPDRTICPSDVARAVGGAGWRRQMGLVRAVATDMAERKLVDLMQRGNVVVGDNWRGPIRIRSHAEE